MHPPVVRQDSLDIHIVGLVGAVVHAECVAGVHDTRCMVEPEQGRGGWGWTDAECISVEVAMELPHINRHTLTATH